jgi:hypothetical protein
MTSLEDIGDKEQENICENPDNHKFRFVSVSITNCQKYTKREIAPKIFPSTIAIIGLLICIANLFPTQHQYRSCTKGNIQNKMDPIMGINSEMLKP